MYLENGIWKWRHTPLHNKETGYEDIIQSLNIISVEDFKKLPLPEQVSLARIVLEKIRSVNIYPIYYFTESGIRNEIIKCFASPVNSVTSASIVEHGRAGSVLLDFLFPNLHLVEAGSSLHNNLYSRFYDDDKMLRILVRHMKNYTFTNMRTPFFMYGRFFWNTATNFSAMRAKAIYEHFAPTNAVVYDFSCGFGGRMLGALSSKNRCTYIGCEPNHNTAYNLNRLGTYIESVSGRHRSYKVYECGSEHLTFNRPCFDFAFSCPPYFTLERYCEEASQSVVAFPEYSSWLANYVKPTLLNVYKGLKPGAYMGIVLAGVVFIKDKPYNLADDWQHIAESVGFTYCKDYSFSTMSRKQPKNAESFRLYRKEE